MGVSRDAMRPFCCFLRSHTCFARCSSRVLSEKDVTGEAQVIQKGPTTTKQA